jgi:hypothetical protein
MFQNVFQSKGGLRVLGVLATSGISSLLLPPDSQAQYYCGTYREVDGYGYVFCLYSGAPNIVCEVAGNHCINLSDSLLLSSVS